MKKFDKKYVYANMLSDFFIILFAVFMFVKDMSFGEGPDDLGVTFIKALPILLAIFAFIYLCFILYRVLYYRTSGYQLTDKEIKCKRGVLFRQNSVLDYKKIHAINKKQNIFQSIFKLAVLTVDSGSASSSHKAEVIIYETSCTVDKLLNELHILREGGVVATKSEEFEETVLLSKKDGLYNFSSKRKMLYTALSIVSTAFFTTAFGVILGIIIGGCNYALKLNLFGALGEYLLWFIIILAGANVLFSLFVLIGCVTKAFVGYYNFKICKKGNDIEISYGLLEHHTNSFSYDRIKGVKIHQDLLQRIFGFASIKVEVIGYTNETGKENVEIGVLVPFCKFCEINEILTKILPDYILEKKQTKAVKFFPFVSWFTLILGIVVGMITALVYANLSIFNAPTWAFNITIPSILCVGIIIYLIGFINAYINYKTSGITLGKNKITTYSGGFQKAITIFNTKNLSSIEKVTTPLRSKAGIATYVFHLKTNESSNEIKVLMQSEKMAKDLEDMLIL